MEIGTEQKPFLHRAGTLSDSVEIVQFSKKLPEYLGGGFKYVLFSSLFGEDSYFD